METKTRFYAKIAFYTGILQVAGALCSFIWIAIKMSTIAEPNPESLVVLSRNDQQAFKFSYMLNFIASLIFALTGLLMIANSKPMLRFIDQLQHGGDVPQYVIDQITTDSFLQQRLRFRQSTFAMTFCTLLIGLSAFVRITVTAEKTTNPKAALIEKETILRGGHSHDFLIISD
jgi:hypothetical protein